MGVNLLILTLSTTGGSFLPASFFATKARRHEKCTKLFLYLLYINENVSTHESNDAHRDQADGDEKYS